MLYDDYQIKVTLLDIDERFDYLPGFVRFDITTSDSTTINIDHKFKTILFDPPFFGIDLAHIVRLIDRLTITDRPVQLLIGYLRREDAPLLRAFHKYGLVETNFKLEYARVKESKWANYALYANCDLVNIRRVKKKR